MNEQNEQNQIVYELDSEGSYILDKLAKWNKIIGIFLVAMGIMTLLTIFIDYTNPFSVILSILLCVFMVYLGTRLTSASAHLKHSLYEENSNSLRIGLNNLRQYFLITGISYIVVIIFMVLAMIFGAFFGFAVEDFSEF